MKYIFAILCLKINLIIFFISFPAYGQLNKEYKPLDITDNFAYSEKFIVNNIIVRGVSIFQDEEIQKITASFINEVLSFDKVRLITQKITDLYISRGFITSGAFFPEQDLTSKTLIIQVVEGKLEAIDILSNGGISNKYILSNLNYDLDNILNVTELEKSIQLFVQNPLIRNVEATLVEGSDIGRGRLLLEVEQESPWSSSLTFNNYNSVNSGEYQGEIDIVNQNLLGFSDKISIGYSLSEGFDSPRFAYNIPVDSNQNGFTIGYENGSSTVVRSNFRDFGIRAEAKTLSFQYDQTIEKSLERDINLFVALDARSSDTFIEDNIPFSFVEGPVDGRSQATVLRFGTSITQRSRKTVVSANMLLNFGIDLFNPTKSDDLPDGLFFSWLGQLQFAQALNKEQDILFVTRLSSQLTPDSLLPLEKISVGGANSVRGYRENREVADNAVVGTVEFQLPLLTESKIGKLNLVPFFDAGIAWNTDAENSVSLASLGIGIKWDITDFINLNIDYGIPLIQTNDLETSLQDSGIHFKLQFLPF